MHLPAKTHVLPFTQLLIKPVTKLCDHMSPPWLSGLASTPFPPIRPQLSLPSCYTRSPHFSLSSDHSPGF